MEEKVVFEIPPYWHEPAHPGVVKLYEDMVAIYSLIREKCQKEIDAAFDSVSRQIGFVLTTTVPVVVNIGDKGGIKDFSVGYKYLKGTLFDRELSAALRPLVETREPLRQKVAPGTYRLFLLWQDALSLKLRTAWIEPPAMPIARQAFMAEMQSEVQAGLVGRKPVWECCECVQWFDPGYAIAAEDLVQIYAIDSVYPEFRLVDRIASIRAALRKRVGGKWEPGPGEPVHPPPCESE